MSPTLTEGAPAPGRATLLHNGRFHDVERGGLLPDGTRLLLSGATIDAVLAPGAPSPAGALRLDLGGRHVVPGLMNAHAHLQLVLPSLLAGPAEAVRIRRSTRAQVRLGLRQCLEHGVTTVHDALTADLDDNRRPWRGSRPAPRRRQSVLLGPLGGAFSAERGLRDRVLYAVAGLPFVTYQDRRSGIVAFAPQASAQQIRDAVDRAVDERGAEGIKLYDQRELMFSYEPGARLMSQAQLDAAVDQARRRGVPSTMHHVTVESLRRGVRAGVGSLAHLPSDGPLTERDLESFVRSGCVLVPTASLAFALCFSSVATEPVPTARLAQLDGLRKRRVEATSRFWRPELASIYRRGFMRAARGATRLFGLVDMGRVFRYFAGIAGHGLDNLGRLAAAGAAVACGNDAGAVPCTAAMVGLELELLGALGGDALRGGASLLRAATLHSARALGLESSHGTIAPGRVADLAVLEGDPLVRPELLGAPAAAVLLGGELVVNRLGLGVARHAA